MPTILFAVDEHNSVKVLKIEMLEDEHYDVTCDDITEMETGIFRDDEDYSLGVYKGSLRWVDTTIHYPEYEADGYWEIADDFELVTNLEDEI